MKSILILGAGMSSSSLIKYLLSHAKKYDWNVQVVDQDIELVKRKINKHERGEALSFNAIDSEERKIRIAKADLVISMLPAWDPKETWAMVSVLVYAVILHFRFIPKVNGKFVFNAVALWGYSAILFTFFGVNFMLVGLHSYAQGEGLGEFPKIVE